MADKEENVGTTEGIKEHLSVVDRYYKRKYKIGTTADTDVCILCHSNRICVVTLAPSHPAVTQKKTLTAVSFDVCGANRLDNKVSGKGKKGAQMLKSTSELCKITTDDGEVYTITTGIPAQLVEVNEALLQNPNLLTLKPQSDGYIAIVLPKLKDYEYVMSHLLSEEEYKEVRPTTI